MPVVNDAAAPQLKAPNILSHQVTDGTSFRVKFVNLPLMTSKSPYEMTVPSS
jgi:hypothetical protein